jgi:copper chaperone CopZ
VVFAVCAATCMMWKRYRIVRRCNVVAVTAPPSGASTTGPRSEAPYRESSNVEATMTTAGGSSFRVKGMKCDACVATITRELAAHPGIVGVEVHLEKDLVTVRWGDGFGGMETVQAKLRTLGYETV